MTRTFGGGMGTLKKRQVDGDMPFSGDGGFWRGMGSILDSFKPLIRCTTSATLDELTTMLFRATGRELAWIFTGPYRVLKPSIPL